MSSTMFNKDLLAVTMPKLITKTPTKRLDDVLKHSRPLLKVKEIEPPRSIKPSIVSINVMKEDVTFLTTKYNNTMKYNGQEPKER